MKKGIVIAGNIFVDYIKVVESFPRKGMLANIIEERMAIGGCVSNTIIDLAKMDPSLPLRAVSVLGEDERSRFIIDLFDKYGIDHSRIKFLPGAATGYTDVITSRADNTRTFFNLRGSNSVFDMGDIDFDSLDADLFHIGYALLLDRFDREDPEYGTVMARTLAKARDTGVKTSMDVVSEDSDRFARIVRPALKHCDYLVINEVEGSMVAGIKVRDETGKLLEGAMKDACAKLKDLGVLDTVILHSPEGGYLLGPDGYCSMPSIDVPGDYIKGTVGAGDAFAAGALYAFYHGWDPLRTLNLANCSAAANLSSTDSISGARSLNELLALGEKYKLQGD
ncbi:MAG: carbohydrate kinase family protein [Treponema sp.]|jgi:sugar/nucleoside kinase (ribokinase family)|nr:carbohydrate kinase family protein [Treponema sp.]